MSLNTQRAINQQRKDIAELYLREGRPGYEPPDGIFPDPKEVKQKLKEARMEKLLNQPKLRFTMEKLGGTYISHTEISDLIQYFTIGPAVKRPRWCHIAPKPQRVTQTVLIRVDCPGEFVKASYEFLDKFFERQHIKAHEELYDREDFFNNLLHVPVSLQEQIKEKLAKMDAVNLDPREFCLKSELVLSSTELIDFEYPFPSDTIIPTKELYAPITNQSPMFSLDCEMCITTSRMHELTRISLIREDGSVVFDTLVKPPRDIIDYLTKFSGVTPEMLEGVTVTLEDVQKALSAVLPPDAILVGHSLEFDLKALQMSHPYILDIGRRFNLSGSTKMRTSLKNLSDLFCDESIQDGKGHCSVEDSWAAMKLAKLKVEKGLVFGSCLFGWDYEAYIKKHRQQIRDELEAEEEEERESQESGAEPVNKRIRLMPKTMVAHCACGQRLGLDCIIEGCQCQVSPPSECILCLAKHPAATSEGATFDWKKAVRSESATTLRTIDEYLKGSKGKKLMFGMEAIKKAKVPVGELIIRRLPSEFPDQQDYIEEVCMDMLEYALCVVELNFNGDVVLPDDPNDEEQEELEDGQLPDNSAKLKRAINAQIEQLIRTAAKYSMILVMLTSPDETICYIRLKT
ncbi:unnamed protein product, partial [Mesorhabditis spiculigera]